MVVLLAGDPKQYCRRISAVLLSKVLRPSDYKCDALRSLAREVFTNNVCGVIIPPVRTPA